MTISSDNFRYKYTYLKFIINKTKKKNRYFKYLIFNYRFDNNNVFYKNVDPLIKK